MVFASNEVRSGLASAQSEQSLRCLHEKSLSYPLSVQQIIWSDWADAQADLSLCWVHLPFCWFCHEAAQLLSWSKPNPTKWPVHSGKIQISLVICPVWSESLPCTLLVAKDPNLLQADSEDSDQTERIPRLIWAFAWCTYHHAGFIMLPYKSFADIEVLYSFQQQVAIIQNDSIWWMHTVVPKLTDLKSQDYVFRYTLHHYIWKLFFKT